MSMPEQVTDRVFLVGGSQLSRPSDCLVYALNLGNAVLIDCGAGSGWQRIRKHMVSAGLDPANLHTLVLTHAHVDHIGAAAEIKAETGCRVVAHTHDAPFIESGDPGFTVSHLYGVDLVGVKVDHRLEGEEEKLSFSEGELTILHTPGHTPGSVVAEHDGEDGRVLFGQDIHGPFSPAFQSDIEAWKKSMQRLLERNADVLCEGHFGIFRPAEEVRRFIQGQLDSHKSMLPEPVPM
jgi:glyoxylase-like metal-dependent hydrolase (beta-lactamase superfamily II)